MSKRTHIYLTKEGGENLKRYQYAGEDLSYYYRFVLTPMNVRLIEFFPMWMAPNVITLVGFVFSASSFFLSTYYCSDFASPMPSWLYLWCGLCVWLYQTLDNLDGRQARRTNSSSPLGLLFDHGVDALNATVMNLMICCMLQLGTGWKLWLLWTTCAVNFYLVTWEEYFVGKLTLPVINGPSDGLLLVQLFCLLAAYSPGMWASPIKDVAPWIQQTPLQFVGESELHYIPIGTAITLFPMQVALPILSVIKSGADKTKALQYLFPLVSHIVLALAWAYGSQTSDFTEHPRLFLLGCGFVFCSYTCRLMLAHLCHEDFQVFHWTVLPNAVALVIASVPRAVLPSVQGVSLQDMNVYLFLLVTFCNWLHFAVVLTSEITSLLRIKCFSIPHKQH